MTEDLKWSNYDFTKIPFDDIVQVGQRTLLYRDIFSVSWLLGRFSIIVAVIVGLTPVATVKTTDPPNFVLKQLMK